MPNLDIERLLMQSEKFLNETDTVVSQTALSTKVDALIESAAPGMAYMAPDQRKLCETILGDSAEIVYGACNDGDCDCRERFYKCEDGSDVKCGTIEIDGRLGEYLTMGFGFNSDVYPGGPSTSPTTLRPENNRSVAAMHLELGIPIPFTAEECKKYFIELTDETIKLTKGYEDAKA